MPVTVDEDIIPEIRNVVHLKSASPWKLPEQKLDACNLTYFTQGKARYIINGKHIDVEQGGLLVLPKDTVRRAITFSGRLMHCFSVDFRLKNAKYQEVSPPFPVSSQPGRQEDIIHLFYDLSFSWLNKPPGYGIKSMGLFLQIFHRFLELLVYKNDEGTGDSRITKATRYLAAHYAERVSVNMMAKMAGLNPAYFGLLFRKKMGMSLNRYLIQLRVKNAEAMLQSGDYKVGDIAEACGFIDLSHFYKQFKELKGFPPSHCLPKKF